MRISDWSSDVCSSDLVDQRRRQQFHAGGVHLQGQRVAETVDDHAGQAVRLGMDEAVAWHANQALAEGEGTSEAAGEKLGVDSDCLVAGEHTRGDQRVAVEEGCRPIAADRKSTRLTSS